LRPLEKRLPRKRFHFQLAAEAVSSRLGGFDHNAVSPFGLLTDLPIVVCKRCIDLKFPYLYMGGGKVDVKLGISVSDFLRSTGAIVGTISTQRKVLL
jgi:prolyl-tRNA editing enzyme YbaK/EbsC (Cys-tRNA(Pro) deacylase)